MISKPTKIESTNTVKLATRTVKRDDDGAAVGEVPSVASEMVSVKGLAPTIPGLAEIAPI